MAESIGDILGLETQADGKLKVRSRERRDLEFKECCDENTRKICLKTIAAFANTGGGCIVFGVTDSPPLCLRRRSCNVSGRSRI